jgi:predicted metal-dependent phosphoesterase TrpH
VTDHDTIINTKRYKDIALKNGIRLFPATEISTTGKDMDFPDMHILGYGISDVNTMENLFNEYKARNQEICERVITKLQEMGVAISLADVKLLQTNDYITKRDIARCMLVKGYATTNKEVYDVYMGREQPAYVPTIKMPVQEAIALINCCGGIAVLAHPGLLPDDTEFIPLLSALKGLGLKGIETVNACHEEPDVKYFRMLAKLFSLVETCGSDFHNVAKDRFPGFEVEDEFIRPFYDLLGK